MRKNWKEKFKYKIKKPQIGDHIWWISDLSKFKGLSKMKQRYNIKMIVNEMYEFLK